MIDNTQAIVMAVDTTTPIPMIITANVNALLFIIIIIWLTGRYKWGSTEPRFI
jgi:hypothetical protein